MKVQLFGLVKAKGPMKSLFAVVTCILLLFAEKRLTAQVNLPPVSQPPIKYIPRMRPARPWDAPEKPKRLPYHTFDLRYLDGTEDRVTGIIEKIGNEYIIMKNMKARSVHEKQIKMSELSYVEIIDDIENTVVGIKTDSAWLFPSSVGIVTVYSTFEGHVKRDLPVSALQKNLGPIYSYSSDVLNEMIADNDDAKKQLLKGRPMAAINLYNEDYRKNVSNVSLESSDLEIAGNSDAEPKFIGGQAAWEKYLKINLRYPSKAARKNIQQNVQVEFKVNTDGIPHEIRVVNGNSLFHEEAVRLVRESGRWLPAVQEGRYVQATTIQTIPFSKTVIFRQ